MRVHRKWEWKEGVESKVSGKEGIRQMGRRMRGAGDVGKEEAGSNGSSKVKGQSRKQQQSVAWSVVVNSGIWPGAFGIQNAPCIAVVWDNFVLSVESVVVHVALNGCNGLLREVVAQDGANRRYLLVVPATTGEGGAGEGSGAGSGAGSAGRSGERKRAKVLLALTLC